MRFGFDQAAQYLSNRIAATKRFARLVYEMSLRFVQRNQRIEITGVETLFELARPILGLIRQCCGHCCDEVPDPARSSTDELARQIATINEAAAASAAMVRTWFHVVQFFR